MMWAYPKTAEPNPIMQISGSIKERCEVLIREKVSELEGEVVALEIMPDPRNTSRTCSQCGHCEKANRKSQAKFHCLSCGFDVNTDKNAAMNIGVRASSSESLLSQLRLRPTA